MDSEKLTSSFDTKKNNRLPNSLLNNIIIFTNLSLS